jgi:hypothetical protein
MRIAVAVIHGMGTEEKFFSVEMKHRIVESYVKGAEGRLDDDIIFQEIYWGDLVKDLHSELVENANYKGDLSYMNLRELFVDYMGTATVYRERLYGAIHNRVKEGLAGLSGHRRVNVDKTPLVILAHSFGSVIMSDYIYDTQKKSKQGEASSLSNFEQFKTLAGLITFGSPLAIQSMLGGDFEKPIEICGEMLDKDTAEKVKWLNFYDKDDIIAYPLKQLNEQYKAIISEDLEINVGSAATSWNPACHSGYWEDKDFYKPVAHYIGELRGEHKSWERD